MSSEQKEKSADQSLSKTFLKRIKKEKTADMHSIRDNLIEQNNEKIKIKLNQFFQQRMNSSKRSIAHHHNH